MFTEYFGFKENPFNLAGDFSFFCIDAHRQKLCQFVLTDLCADSKPTLLTGGVGVGKSQFLQYLLSQLPAEFQSVCLTDGCVNYAEKVRALLQQIPAIVDSGKKLVVIIDNAQEMVSDDLSFLLSARAGNGSTKPFFHLILCGSPELTAKLASLNATVSAEQYVHTYSLTGLNAQQVNEYIKFRLQRAGYDEESKGQLFLSEAVSRIAALSNGIPHAINLLCGASLLIASFDDQRHVNEQIVQEAALSCLLPVDVDDSTLLVEAQGIREQINTPFRWKRIRQTRRFNQRMLNWQRLPVIHRRRLPIARSAVTSDISEFEQAKRKRLVRGVLTLGFSLSFLISLQHFEQPAISVAQNDKAIPVLDNQLAAVPEKSEQPATMIASNMLPVTVHATSWSTSTTAAASAVDATTKNNEPLPAPTKVTNPDLHTVHKNVPAATLLAKIDTGKVDQGLVGKGKDGKKVGSAQENKELRRLLVAQIVSDTLARAKQASAANAASTPAGIDNAKFEHVNFDLAGFTHTKKPSINSYALDAQEMATKKRAASRLNLDKLGVEYGVEALMDAARTGDLHVIKLLLTGGIPADIKNSQGETALMIAARNGYKSVVKELLRVGAHPNIKDKQGLTALMHANQNHFTEITTLLNSYAAKG